MKKLLMLFTAAMLLLSVGVCSAQTPTPKQKAKHFVERIFQSVNEQDFSKLEKIGNDMGAYINTLTEAQGEEFGEAFAGYIYEYSDKYGYGKEFADQFLAAFSQALIEQAQE